VYFEDVVFVDDVVWFYLVFVEGVGDFDFEW